MHSVRSFGVLLILASVASAQPEPTPPAPDPTAPVPTPPEPAPSDQPAPVEPAPVEPAPVEPAPVEPPKKDEPPPVTVSWDKGILFKSDDDKHEARLALRSQLRFESFRSTADGAESQSRFYLPRVRLQLEGHVYGDANRYKLELGMSERGSFTFVKDYFVEREVTKGVWARIGQWKRPFSRQEMTSDFSGTFNERSIANEFAGGGRDLGFAVHNDYEKSPEGIEWVAGIFNGFSGGNDRPKITTTCDQDPATLDITCTNPAVTNFPTDFAPALVARVGYNHGKIKGYSEIDLEGGPLRFSVAANYKVDLADLDGSDAMSHGIGVDANIKVNGFDATVAGYGMKIKDAKILFGGFAQAGFLVVPKKVHVAGRFAFNQLAGTDNKQIEARAAFTYLFSGHAVKIATDAGIVKTTGGGDPEIQVRIMPQLTF